MRIQYNPSTKNVWVAQKCKPYLNHIVVCTIIIVARVCIFKKAEGAALLKIGPLHVFFKIIRNITFRHATKHILHSTWSWYICNWIEHAITRMYWHTIFIWRYNLIYKRNMKKERAEIISIFDVLSIRNEGFSRCWHQRHNYDVNRLNGLF